MRDQPKAFDLLEWYDVHARKMPWRIGPADRAAGVMPDPYRIWMSEIMLQQTTVAAVKDYFLRFTKRWPTVSDLAAAEDADVMGAWAGLGYYARARNLLKCARYVVDECDGEFPGTYDELLKLPGVGPYTAGAVSAIAYDQASVVVDGNVERVMSRLFDIHTPLPTAKPELTERAAALTPSERPGDYAQAVMDLGATICTPKNPACGICPWRAPCKARLAGTAAELPKKTPKKPKPIRYGTAYIARRVDGAFLLETRPDKGLLGGMLGWPGSEWVEDDPPHHDMPIKAEWKTLNTEARHTFTHFHLRLKVMTALVPMDRAPKVGEFKEVDDFRPSDLPTVMRKAFDLTKGSDAD
ncbi:A/G-specific adenine glycosylase [Cognatishimia sp. 1_MG-2023]|uniref:A/G-specific adenine glycosylase n=1 Tax=Cognatishimia sp. 1_MG-2023 TaxID=3062642 RepID=UPI0026E1DA18|nr:A/G-specific adenine glycosylase [Cognatishimia sp. 1_MG-2023]MDO6728120.1 A/G-specific adenine glycosylase [Cognatishimia sp. 1_MG-2023]